MEERRSAKRWRMTDYSKDRKKYTGNFFGVYDRADDEFVGYLLDISSEGMMIKTRKTIPEGVTLKLRIELPEEIKGSDQLMVEARSVWCERDTNPEYNRIGLSFTFVFPHHAAIINLLFKGEESIEDHEPESVPSQGQ